MHKEVFIIQGHDEVNEIIGGQKKFMRVLKSVAGKGDHKNFLALNMKSTFNNSNKDQSSQYFSTVVSDSFP